MARSIRRQMQPQTLCAADAAHYCGIGVKAFRAEIQAGNGPRPWSPRLHRDPDRRTLLRYAIGDLDDWIALMGLDPAISRVDAPVPDDRVRGTDGRFADRGAA